MGTSGYQCFHCLHNTVFWCGDFSFEDYGLEGEGLIHVCQCGNCGAEIEYYINLEEETEDDKNAEMGGQETQDRDGDDNAERPSHDAREQS